MSHGSPNSSYCYNVNSLHDKSDPVKAAYIEVLLNFTRERAMLRNT